ncbi:hypothetical protein EUGRSUZ_E00359 [Eucalyptus grandis]|uniref:Uncharacterized protein n=2 Tax=Eucalyptus grandis TaxID=71139 RepID=A0ACC3KRE0_EUCGR|nr:hypothetical protein EUGRSUZ_E00359 [Eucalyptus grandis]
MEQFPRLSDLSQLTMMTANYEYFQNFPRLSDLIYALVIQCRYVKPPIFTLCVGNAWGEAALLLAAGARGNRSALPSSTIMMKQPIARFQGQATDIDLARKEVKNVKAELVLYNETSSEDHGVVSDLKKAQLI